MRKPIIAGNWKMNGTIASGSILIEAFNSVLQDMELSCDVVVCPPFTAIERAVALTRDTAIEVGAQTMDYHDAGAFTGEISPLMLTEVGVNYVIIGHSERRTYFNETDETVNLKVKSALAHGLTPIMCCGESLEQRENGEMQSWVEMQIEKDLAGLTADEVKKVIIAYEPIWAIGTGKTATNEQAQEVCAIIRRKIAALFGSEAAQTMSILYGGSVKGGNIAALTTCADIDGALVGGASLKVDDFMAIIDNAVVK